MGRDTRRTRLLLVGLLVVALVLITIDVGSGKGGGSLRRAADTVTSPVERAAAAAVRPVRNAFDAIGDSDKQKRRADALSSEIANLQRQLARDAKASGRPRRSPNSGCSPPRIVQAGAGTGDRRR